MNRGKGIRQWRSLPPHPIELESTYAECGRVELISIKAVLPTTSSTTKPAERLTSTPIVDHEMAQMPHRVNWVNGASAAAHSKSGVQCSLVKPLPSVSCMTALAYNHILTFGSEVRGDVRSGQWLGVDFSAGFACLAVSGLGSTLSRPLNPHKEPVFFGEVPFLPQSISSSGDPVVRSLSL